MKKPENVKIIQIGVAMNDNQGTTCLGLGDDQDVYFWSFAIGSWMVNKNILPPNAPAKN